MIFEAGTNGSKIVMQYKREPGDEGNPIADYILGQRTSIVQKIADTEDAAIREQLVKLGWAPPDAPSADKRTINQLAATLRSVEAQRDNAIAMGRAIAAHLNDHYVARGEEADARSKKERAVTFAIERARAAGWFDKP